MSKILTLLFGMLFSITTAAKVVQYTFDIDYKTVNFTGKPVQAMAVGGSIPAPTIEATVGDTLRVTFNNKMDVPSSIHWHGVLLPQDQDGVPFLTMKPIPPGGSFTYEYPIVHHGTYWYHSHTGLQEQRGVYGSMVFHPKNGELVEADHDIVVVLSDWTNENPNRVMHNLKKSDDYYALKKDSVQSWQRVLAHGSEAIKNRIEGAWMRMGPMDISDVGYDAFLLNGKAVEDFSAVEPGQSVRLRVINAAASSYFYFSYAGGPMRIVSADGVDVEPVEVSAQRIAIAETFDVIVTVPDSGTYEFRATSEDGTGYASLMLGNGDIKTAKPYTAPNPYLMSHASHSGGNHQQRGGSHHHDHSAMMHDQSPTTAVNDMVEYEGLRAVAPTQFNDENPTRDVLLKLTGDMERYAWSFNGKVFSEDSKILIRKGETVRFILENTTMMHHPIHLHGHFFRVLNGQDDYSPLKHTVSVPAMQTVVIEFLANEEKDWLFHCHNLYHMKSGMTRVVSYAESSKATQGSLRPIFADKHWYHFYDIGAQTNFTHGSWRSENTRNTVELEYEWDYQHDYEIEIHYGRYINRFFELSVGYEIEREQEHEPHHEELAFVSAHYLLPLMLDAGC